MEKIYLIGSFHGFRDKIIKDLPDYSFADPRLHRQSSVAKLVCDDLREAEECPISMSVFPAGKSRGVMSYVEIGVSYYHGNNLIVVDEDCPDPVLKTIANNNFTKLDDAIDYLKTNPDFSIKGNNIKSKYPAGSMEKIGMNKILICGTQTDELEDVVNKASQTCPDKEFVLADDIYKEFSNIADYDLLVANFPGNADWDRYACLLMGGAYAHDISILIMDDHDWKYPPLQAVARRHGTIDTLYEYLTEVEDLQISSEACNMYDFFKREKKRKA